MSAFTIVRFRAKPGMADLFQSTFCGLDRQLPGLTRIVLVKTGDRAFCSIGEWERFDDIVQARQAMAVNLNKMRDLLESFSEELGVTDPCSGDVVMDQCVAHAAQTLPHVSPPTSGATTPSA